MLAGMGRQPKCDFCGTDLVFGESWRFQCDDFSIEKPDGRVQAYAEDWSACPTCKDLIVAGKRDKLAKRAARSVLSNAAPRTDFELAEESAREIQDGFWAHRTGASRLDTKEEWDAPITPARYEDL